MMCTGVIPCVSSGLAKNINIMSMFVLFSWLFWSFESLTSLKKMGVGSKPCTKAHRTFLVNFSKIQQKFFFSKKPGYFK